MSNDPIQSKGVDPRATPLEQTQAPPRRRAYNAGAAEGGVEVNFRALLDRLGEQARLLVRDREGVRDAGHLPGAVERARDTAQDAIALSERLLEAYREAAQAERGPGPQGRS